MTIFQTISMCGLVIVVGAVGIYLLGLYWRAIDRRDEEDEPS